MPAVPVTFTAPVSVVLAVPYGAVPGVSLRTTLTKRVPDSE